MKRYTCEFTARHDDRGIHAQADRAAPRSQIGFEAAVDQLTSAVVV